MQPFFTVVPPRFPPGVSGCPVGWEAGVPLLTANSSRMVVEVIPFFVIADKHHIMSALLSSLLVLIAAMGQDPLAGQLPKQDLGVQAFLESLPEFDGRGIRVAILDTGIDPGHPLLQTTSTGHRKVVDWYDATSDGYLTTATVSRADESGSLIGLSGRRLQLGRWNLPGREFHLGRIDRAFLPEELGDRVEEQRRAAWIKAKRSYEERQLRNDHAAREEGVSREESVKVGGEGGSDESGPYEKFEDAGPVYDVLVFQDESAEWRVLIDSDEDGDMDEETALFEFWVSGDWATLGDETLMNYAVDVHDGGTAIQLFFDTNGHGTHVAGIVGAYGGLNERLNGIAPGVELVAIKIGDGKYSGATSGFAMAKALDYAVSSGCHVANISFGGPSFFADGREPDAWVIDEATRRGLLVVTSAGNNGPALTTVGAPGTSQYAIAVAAAIWPQTQQVNYGSLQPSNPVLFDFSSRGPLPTGALGVDFAAPGAAVSALPSWLITPAENFNGTSMAAPQMAGCAALLRCAARMTGVAHTPSRIYRAMRMSAKPLPNHSWVEQGHGVVRMLPAWRSLQSLAAEEIRLDDIQVRVRNPYGDGEGIYARELVSDSPFERTVNLEPLFTDTTSNAEKASFMRTYKVVAEADWIRVPKAVFVSAQGNRFRAGIHPRGLGFGLHSSRILLFDADQPQSLGPAVIIPVTLVRPHAVTAAQNFEFQSTFSLRPGELRRNFVAVPPGAQNVKVQLFHSGEGLNEYRTGAGSVSGFRHWEARQKRGRFFLNDGQSATQTIPVESGTVFEYAVASRWSTNRTAQLRLHLEFVGLTPPQSSCLVPPGQGIAYTAAKSMLRYETISVKAAIQGVAVPVTAPLRIVPDPIRNVVFEDRGMFYGVIEHFLDLTESTPVVVRTDHSIQTTEIREDLMLEIRDAADKVIQRKILNEVETDLGTLDAGHYILHFQFPSLGVKTLQSQFAGLELRMANQHRKLPVYLQLQDAFHAEHARSSVSIPYMGVRSFYARIPELESLPAGHYYFGEWEMTRQEDELLRIPLIVERPHPVESVFSDSSVAGPETAGGMEMCEEKRAYLAALETDSASEILTKARAWTTAQQHCYEARLAWIRSLSGAGLIEDARRDALSFLAKFPTRTHEFLSAAHFWAP